MDIEVLASGSSGNCSIIKNKETMGLIDIGISWKLIQKTMNYQSSKLDFVLSTHRHNDHSGYIKDAIKAGIDCYAIQDVWDSNNINGHRVHTITPKKPFIIKSLTIMAFEVPHDAPNVGLLIADHDDKFLYLVDCNYSPFRFKGLTLIALAVNYYSEILVNNITCSYIHPEVGKRVLKNHMSLQTAIEFFKANDMSAVREIYLLHLSDENSDAERFRREIQEITGRPVYVA